MIHLFYPFLFPLLQALVDTSRALVAVVENTGSDSWGIDWVQVYVGKEIFFCPVGEKLKKTAGKLNSWMYNCKAQGNFFPLLLTLCTDIFF